MAEEISEIETSLSGNGRLNLPGSNDIVAESTPCCRYGASLKQLAVALFIQASSLAVPRGDVVAPSLVRRLSTKIKTKLIIVKQRFLEACSPARS